MPRASCAHCHEELGDYAQIVRCPRHGDMHERCTDDRSGGFSNEAVCFQCRRTCPPSHGGSVESNMIPVSGLLWTRIERPLAAGQAIIDYLRSRPLADAQAALDRLGEWVPTFPTGRDWDFASAAERLLLLASARARAGDTFWFEAADDDD